MSVEEIAPLRVGAPLLGLTLSDPFAVPRAFRAIDVDVDASAAEPEGLQTPLEMLVTGPSPTSFRRHVFRRLAPSVVSFTPTEGGRFTLALREVGHNGFRGSLTVDVEGERTDPDRTE